MPKPCGHKDHQAIAGEPFSPGRDCHSCWLWLNHPDYRRHHGSLSLPCIHLGDVTGELAACGTCPGSVKIKMRSCELHGRCTEVKEVEGVACCLKCQDRREPNAVQIVVTADGLGDHILGLTAAEGLRRDGKHVVYVAKSHIAPWVELFSGYDHLTTSPVGGIPVLKPHDNYFSRQLPERTARPRWQYYADDCGTNAVLPTEQPLPEDAVRWAESLAGAVCLAPWSAWVDRTWLLAHWLELERLLHRAGYQTVILDAASDRGRVFRGRLLAGESPARVAAVVRAASCVVGNDSGIAHLGGILRTPTVALCALIEGEKLFGIYPTVEVINGPLGCTGCHWGGEARRRAGCSDRGVCASLQAISPQVVMETVDRLTCRKAHAHSLLGHGKLASLRRAVRSVAGLPGSPGSLAELGVYRGGSALAMSDAAPERELHLFDTFEGLPSDLPDSPHRRGEFSCAQAEVEKVLAGRSYRVHAGFFPSTTAGLESEKYACVHLDADGYEATRDGIRYFWPRLVEGGCLVFDDVHWPHTPGVDKAIFEVFASEQVERIDAHQGIVYKRGTLGAPGLRVF